MRLRAVFQSTPPVKAATVYSADKAIYVRISIHAAREGGDPCLFGAFLSLSISIHAAREGGDTAAGVFRKLDKNFNPRRP